MSLYPGLPGDPADPRFLPEWDGSHQKLLSRRGTWSDLGLEFLSLVALLTMLVKILGILLGTWYTFHECPCFGVSQIHASYP